MTIVYIVRGTTGEYSDRSEWLVEAYMDESQAVQKVTELNDKCFDLGVDKDNDLDIVQRRNIIPVMRDYDPGFRLDYTGTTYDIVGVELK